MDLWQFWLDAIREALRFLAADAGLGSGLAVVALAVLTRGASIGGRFLWVTNLARPEVVLAVLAAVTTMMIMAVNPDLPEHLRWIIVLVPAIVTLFAALKVASALALFWCVSNCISSLQTASVYYVAGRTLRRMD